MAVYPVNEPDTIAPLFDGWDETFLWSYLRGRMGSAYADHPSHPRSAQISVGDITFFAGAPNDDLVRHRPRGKGPDFDILVPQTPDWEAAIRRCWGTCATRRMRYATKKEPDAFDPVALRGQIARLPADYELRMVDEALYRQILSLDWARDLCANYPSWRDYAAMGLGVVALRDGTLLSGASSYCSYPGGIEIEIDTREDARRRGLALACGARLILECLERGWYPSWDAHNQGSLALARKLGYRLDREYPAYELSIGQQ